MAALGKSRFFSVRRAVVSRLFLRPDFRWRIPRTCSVADGVSIDHDLGGWANHGKAPDDPTLFPEFSAVYSYDTLKRLC